MNSNKAFTLIELLVVIAIIGLLSSVILVSLNGARDKAKIAKSKTDLHQIVLAIEMARDQYSAILKDITGTVCTACECLSQDLRNISDTSGCATTMKNRWSLLGVEGLPRDGWGSPYIIDENEGENFGGNTCLYRDAISSPGPNGIFDWGGGDDVSAQVPFFVCN